jgi:hypothetical protein
MRTIIKRGILLFAILLSLFITSVVLADPPNPPPPGGSPTGGGGGTPVGAPIDGGLSILLAMGAAYGGKKLYQARKEKHEDEQQENYNKLR